MHPFILVVLLVGGGLAGELGVAAPAFAQAGATRPDSARILTSARREQADFERLRRSLLPDARGGRSIGRCDERIGRFCLTHDDGSDGWQAPPEPERLQGERESLLLSLESAARSLPGDPWIAGQLVRYLVEARRYQEALEAAARCRSEATWCHALSGYAGHRAGLAADADSSFSIALAGMAADRRRRWNDLSLVLDEEGRRAYRGLDDSARADFEQRFWALADPFLTTPGNELRSEHLSRHVMDELQGRAESVDGSSWSGDRREILIRYGWPVGWERVESPLITPGPPELISHLADSPFRFFPPSSAVIQRPPFEGSWDVKESHPRAEYEIPLADSTARWFFPLSHQVALFRRKDELLAVAAYALPADSVPREAAVDAGLALVPLLEPALSPRVTAARFEGNRGVVTGLVGSGPFLLSLELMIPRDGRVARTRSVFHPPVAEAKPSLSDLLLIEVAGVPADSLGAVLPFVRGSPRVRPGEEVGIYWESYDMSLDDTDAIRISLRLVQERSGWLRRLGVRTGLLRQADPVSLRWEEPTGTLGIASRSVGLRIPALASGEYTVELTVELPEADLVSRKVIEVVRE